MSSPYERESYVVYRSRSRPRSRSYSPPARSMRSAQSRSRSPPNVNRMPPPRAPPTTARSSRNQNQNQNQIQNDRKRRSREHPLPPGDSSPPRRRQEVTLLLCVYHSSSHNWSTHPVRFKPDRINSRELWQEIRDCFRSDLQKPWRRIFGFKKVQNIVPIAYSPNNVPIRTDPKDFPASRSLVHAYHCPNQIRPNQEWVDYFVSFDSGDKRQNGLEFVEGLWAEKLGILAVVASVAIVVVSIVWCALGGNLQTVFTVMSFVLTLVAAQIALLALYYQVISSNSPSS